MELELAVWARQDTEQLLVNVIVVVADFVFRQQPEFDDLFKILRSR